MTSDLILGNKALKEKSYAQALKHYHAAIAHQPELTRMIKANIELVEKKLALNGGASAEAPGKQVSAETIDIVVPVYNALDDVKLCLQSLAKHTDGFKVRVLVVNDGSDEPTTQWLREFCASDSLFQLIVHPANKGYTCAVNTGLRASTAEYVITQNSDTIVPAGWLQGMVRCMKSDLKIGVVGPLSNAATWQNVPILRDESGSFAVNDLPEGQTVDTMATLVASVSRKHYPRLPFVNGFCFMIRRAVIDSVGYMDEENFPVGYGEENDYCIRVTDAGFVLVIADDVYVFHAKSKSFGHERRKALSEQGTRSLKQKHTEGKLAALLRLAKESKCLDELRVQILQKIAVTKSQSAPQISTVTELTVFPEPIFCPKGYRLERELGVPQIAFDHMGSAGTDRAWGNLNLKIGVHAHIYYPDLTEEISDSLANIKCKFNLYVSCKSQEDLQHIQKSLSDRLPQAKIKIKVTPNRGRDIGPMLCEFASDLLENDVICHVHSKQSPHNLNKQDWRRQLLHGLFASEEHVLSILSLLRDNKKLGMIFPEYHWSLKTQIHWGGNFNPARELLSRWGLSAQEGSLALFPAGSMFWARSDALKQLLQSKWKYSEFDDELSQVDGTLAHAIERCFGEIVTQNGYKLVQVSPTKPYNLRSYFTKRWPYNRPPQTSLNSNSKGVRGVIYSAVSGGYDQLLDHEIWANEIDHRMMSDGSISDPKKWTISVLSRQSVSPVRFARYVKTDPYKYCSDHNLAVWIDANVLIRTDISKYLELCHRDPSTPLFLIDHPERRCVFDEAEAVIASKKDAADRVKEQMERYKKEGMPKNIGLIETNLMVINLYHSATRAFFEMWKKEIENGSHRDQLSVNYCLWKLGIKHKPIFKEKMSLRDSKDFGYFGHGKNSGLIEG